MRFIFLLIAWIFSNEAVSQPIFKNGFENTGTVAGSVTGLANVPVELKLISVVGAEVIDISENGTFIFAQEITAGASYTVTVSTQPSGQFCIVSNGEGSMIVGGVENVLVNCGDSNNWDEMNWDEGQWQ